MYHRDGSKKIINAKVNSEVYIDQVLVPFDVDLKAKGLVVGNKSLALIMQGFG